MKSNVLKVLVLACLYFPSLDSWSQKDTIRIGVFIESLYDINFALYAFNTNFWMWSVAKGDTNGDGIVDAGDSMASLDRIKLIALSNAKDYEYSSQMAFRVESKGQVYWWATQFCRAKMYQKWELESYPFDDQEMVLKFENTAFDTTQAIMLNSQDTVSFKEDINLIGWDIYKSRIHSSVVKYNTDFGDPNGNGSSYYSRVVFTVQLQRIAAFSYFVKLCLGAFVAFLVALLAFAIGPPGLESRFGLGVGALFAVAANKYVVDLSIPENATNCLIDKIHEVSFVYILLTLVASVISIYLERLEKVRARKIFDISSAAIVFITYVLIIWQFGLVANGYKF
jgi:hypothetical protein